MRTLRLSALGLRPRPRVATASELGAFLVSRAAFVAQKLTVEYCRARAGLGWQQLVGQPAFADALERCRWETFAAVVGDVAETCQILLRHHGAPRDAAGTGLAAVAASALSTHPLPAHRLDWSDTAGGLPARLERALLAAPRPVHTLGTATVPRVLELLPFHPRLKNADRDVVENGLRLALCGVYAEMERRLDPAALAAALAEPALDGTR